MTKTSSPHTITIFGASGKVGRQVVAGALQQGFAVRAFVHRRPLDIRHRQLTSVKGDIQDAQSIAAAIKGSDAIVSCLSSWGAPQKNVLSTAMAAIIPAMQKARIKRIISVTGSDAHDAGDQPPLVNRVSHSALGLIAPGVLQDGEKHIALLRASKLDWTVVRSPGMLPGRPSHNYHLSLQPAFPVATIRRADVATALVAQLADDSFYQQAPVIHRGKR